MAELLVRCAPASAPQQHLPEGRRWSRPEFEIELSGDAAALDGAVHDTDAALCVLLGEVTGGRKAADVHKVYTAGGLAAVARLDGHFIALLHDRATESLYLVRDRAGFGHAYHWARGDRFGISTSLPWLARDRTEREGRPPSPSPTGLALYLTYQYLPSPYTVVDGIQQLEPGSAWRYEPGAGVSAVRLAAFPSAPGDPAVSWDDGGLRTHGDHILELITAEAADRIGGREGVAMLLSGGIDSSTNALVLAQCLGLRPVAFTASFHEEFYDETRYAQSVAKHLGIEHTAVPVRPSMLEVLPDLVRAFDSPNADQAAFAEYVLGRAIREAGLDLVVTGEGGDEVLGPPQSNLGELDVQALPNDSMELARTYLAMTDLATARQRATLFARLGVAEDVAYEPLARVYAEHGDRAPFERLLFGQWRTWLIDGVYMKDSRVMRGCGLAPVFPMMGNTLMQYVADLPVSAKLTGLHDKQFLRTVIAPSLPQEIMQRDKHKFWLPTGQWLRGAAGDLLRTSVLARDAVSLAAFDRAHLLRLLEEHEQGQADHSRVLWALLFLELWWKCRL